MVLNYKTVDAEKVFPLLGVFDGVALGKKGTLTLGWEVSFPVACSASEGDYDEMVEAFASAVRVLPPWTVVHRQDVYTRDTWRSGGEEDRSFLRRSYDAHFEGREFLTHRAYLFVTFAGRYNVMKSGKGSGLFGINPVVEVPSPAEFGAFRSKCEEFTSILTTGGRVRVRELTEADWLGEGPQPGVIQKVMMLGDSSPVMSHVALSPEHVSVKDRTAFCFAIGESDFLPGEVSDVSRVDALSTSRSSLLLSTGAKLGVLLDCEHIVNQYVIVPPQDEILKSLDKERKKMFSGMKDTDNRINGEEIAQYLDEVYRDGLFTVRTHLNVIAWDTDENLQQAVSKVSAAITAMGVEGAVYNNFNTPLLWYASIPSCATELGKENMMTAELRSALCLGAYETFEPEGGWRTDNKTILNQLVSDFIREVPSLLPEGREPVLDDFFRWVDGSVAPKIRYRANTSSKNGRARSEDSIDADYRENGWWIGNVRITPDLFDVSGFILSMKEYAKGGAYSFLLNDPSPKDLFTSRFTVFEVDRLSQDDRKFYSLCVLSIINAFERKMRLAGGFKVMVIDEAWKAIANEQMGGYIASLYKTARKFSCSVMTISQEVADISKSPTVKTAILDNSDVKILLDQSNHLNTFDELSSLLSLTDMDRNLVLSMNRSNDRRYRYREVFIKLGSQRSNVYATEVSPEEALAFESDKVRKAPLYSLAEELGGSVIAAIKKTSDRR